MPSKYSIGRLLLPSAIVLTAVAAVLMLYRPAAAQTGAVDEPYATGAREIFVPVLEALHEDGRPCLGEIVVQNVGAEPSKGIAIYWGVSSGSGLEPGPLKAECTGLISPGASWRMSGPEIPAGALSAIVYSGSTKTLSEIGLDLGFDDIVADYLCEVLFFSVVGDAGDALRFQRAAREGGEFAGLPMDRVLGAPLSVLVDRDCSDGSMRYAGVSSTDALNGGSVGGDEHIDAYAYVSPLHPASPGRELSPQIAAMNVGLEMASVEIFTRPHLGSDPSLPPGAECPPRAACGSIFIGPGETAIIYPKLHGCLEGDGSAWLSSDQPLAVIVDGVSSAGRISAAALRVSSGGSAPGSSSGSGAPSADAAVDRLSAPLVYHEYRGWTTIVHVANGTDAEAGARLSVKDRSGAVIDRVDFRLCPLGGRSLSLGGDLTDVPSNFVGAISIEALGATAGAAGSEALSATVELVRQDETGEPVAAAAYEILPAEADDGLIGVPSLIRGAETEGSSWIAIQNRVSRPGFTDFGMYIFDASGLLDYLCFHLRENEVEYLDLSTLGYLSRGFKGSALISAAYWDYFDDTSDEGWGPVSLGAVVIDAPNETSSSIAPPVITDGPAHASMLPALDSDSSIEFPGFPACPSGPPPDVRTSYAYLPNLANARPAPADPEPIFPTSAP